MSKYCIGLLGFMLFQLSCKNVQESSTSRSDTSTDVQPNIVITDYVRPDIVNIIINKNYKQKL